MFEKVLLKYAHELLKIVLILLKIFLGFRYVLLEIYTRFSKKFSTFVQNFLRNFPALLALSMFKFEWNFL